MSDGERLTTLTDDMKRVVLEQRLGFVATVCWDGTSSTRSRGRARVYTDGDVYERGLAPSADRGFAARQGRIRSVVVIGVEYAAPLVSPVDDSGAREGEVAKRWQRHFEEPSERRRSGAVHIS
jgi:hypothetical protein